MTRQAYEEGVAAMRDRLGIKPKISRKRQLVLDYLHAIDEEKSEIEKIIAECARSDDDMQVWITLALKWQDEQKTREDDFEKK